MFRFQEARRNFTDKNYWRFRGQAEPYDNGTKWASVHTARDESEYIPVAHQWEEPPVQKIIESINDIAGEIADERRRKANLIDAILSLNSVSDELKIQILQRNFGLVDAID